MAPDRAGQALHRGSPAQEWLSSESFAAFVARQWRREPYAESATAAACVPLLDAGTAIRFADTVRGLDVLVVRDGSLVSQQPPSSSEELKQLVRRGCSFVFRNTERHDPDLAALADAVEARLDGEVAVQLYLTPASHHSFGWHYDYEEVIIVQTGGTKEYRLRRNTVNPCPTPENMPRDMKYELETTPVQSVTLVPGDWLHIPSGWWHMALAENNSLSISIGVLPRQALAK